MSKDSLQTLVDAGLHFGYSKSRRHPSMGQFIFTTKGVVDIFNLEKTKEAIERAQALMTTLGEKRGLVLFVGTKPEAKGAISRNAMELSLPYVTERWIGGILTNFTEIRKRVDTMLELKEEQEKGLLDKYTKKERLDIARKIVKLERYFAGLVGLDRKPDLVVVIDPKKEHIAVTEAKKLGIPVLTLANTDCDAKVATITIPANDASQSSISFVMQALAEGYRVGTSKA